MFWCFIWRVQSGQVCKTRSLSFAKIKRIVSTCQSLSTKMPGQGTQVTTWTGHLLLSPTTAQLWYWALGMLRTPAVFFFFFLKQQQRSLLRPPFPLELQHFSCLSFLRQSLETRPTNIPDKVNATRNVYCIRIPTWDSLNTRLLQLISPLFLFPLLCFSFGLVPSQCSLPPEVWVNKNTTLFFLNKVDTEFES